MTDFKTITTLKQILQQGRNCFIQSPDWCLSAIWLSFICLISFFWGLGSTGLVDETEPLFAEAARQIIVTNDWITPYFNGETRFDKPILIYWLMAFCYKLFGVNEWAVRFPSAISATCLTIFVFYTLRYFGFTDFKKTRSNRSQLWLNACIGSAIVSFNVQTIVWARTGVSDMLLSSCIGISLLSFFWGYVEEENKKSSNSFLPNKWYLCFYIFSALAVLAKGPIGLVLPTLIIASFSLYLGQFRQLWREMKVSIGILIFLLITLPWYILVIIKNGDSFLNSFFGYHNLERFTGVVNGHDAAWYFYFLIILGLFAPWSLYLPVSLARIKFWRPIIWKNQSRQDRLGLFAFFWFIVIFSFFTIATTKLPSYVLPLIPAATILVTRSFDLNYLDRLNRRNVNVILNIILAIAIIITLIFLPQIIGTDPAEPDLAKLIAASILPTFAIIIWGITALVLVLLLWQRKQWKWLVVTNIISFALFVILFLNPLTLSLDRLRQQPLREITQTIVKARRSSDKIWMFGFKKPSVVFYSHQQVVFVKNDDFLPQYRPQLEKYPAQSSLLLLTQNTYFKQLKLRVQDYRVIDTKGTYLLIRVPVVKILAVIDLLQKP